MRNVCSLMTTTTVSFALLSSLVCLRHGWIVSCESAKNDDSSIVARMSPKTVSREARLAEIRRRWFPVQSDVGFAEYELNVQASNKIPLDRPIPDFRPNGCDRKSNSSYDDGVLPDVSVIIPVYNEAWSMLLRALHSIIARTPDRLLREIILVDDNSTYAYLGRPLNWYAEALSHKVRILRNRRREGLIRARLRGATEAQGEVLVFLDAHVEVGIGWLEPLLRMIRQDRTTLVLPQVDSIDVSTIAYETWDYVAHGGFTWGMNYIWKYLPPEEAAVNRKRPTEPFRSPTALGCALAIDRRFFFDIGAFDDGMFIWGGENIELSFRTWLCGGSIYVAPCSRVGHAFRRWLPYEFPESFGGTAIKRQNYQRVVDVWLDDYRKYYYAIKGHVTSDLLDESYHRSLAARKSLRRKLRCRSFSWFMDNIVPDMAAPEVGEAVHFGQLWNLAGSGCMTSSSSNDDGFLRMTSCGWHDMDHSFSYVVDSTVRSSRLDVSGRPLCLTALSEGYAVLQPCRQGQTTQRWSYDVSRWTSREERLYRSLYGKAAPVAGSQALGKLSAQNDLSSTVCLSQVTLSNGEQIAGLLDCNRTSDKAGLYQFWSFSYNFLNWNISMPNN